MGFHTVMRSTGALATISSRSHRCPHVPEQEVGHAHGELPDVLTVGKQASLNLSSHLKPLPSETQNSGQHPPAHRSAAESLLPPRTRPAPGRAQHADGGGTEGQTPS